MQDGARSTRPTSPDPTKDRKWKTYQEALGIWYPSHQSFLDLMSAPASSENMRLRALAVERADLHRCQAY